MLDITVRSEHTISFEIASRIAAEVATGAMRPIYEQVSPETLGNDLRDLSVATAYGRRLAKVGKNARPGTVQKLVEDYPTHEFIIDFAEAQTLFEDVQHPTAEVMAVINSLGEIAYDVRPNHVIGRLDGDSNQTGEERDVETEPERSNASGVDEGRKKHRPRNRKKGSTNQSPPRARKGSNGAAQGERTD